MLQIVFCNLRSLIVEDNVKKTSFHTPCPGEVRGPDCGNGSIFQ